jgi:hypothetical protein
MNFSLNHFADVSRGGDSLFPQKLVARGDESSPPRFVVPVVVQFSSQ